MNAIDQHFHCDAVYYAGQGGSVDETLIIYYSYWAARSCSVQSCSYFLLSSRDETLTSV